MKKCLAFVVIFVGMCMNQLVPVSFATEEKGASWSYGGKTGPEYWGELDPRYKICARGKQQSPINIETSQVKKKDLSKDFQIHYSPSTVTIENTGHTIQANVTSEQNQIQFADNRYTLSQFHFHTPSEHQLNGKKAAMELHLVHTDKDGKIAVMGVLIEEGAENQALKEIWGNLPIEETDQPVEVAQPVDVSRLLPSDKTLFQYSGSLTTPPCTEGVNWIVFKEPIHMSKDQIATFREMFPDNHRPVQPLMKREIFKSKLSQSMSQATAEQVLNHPHYDIVTKTYTKGKVKVKYPQLVNLADQAKQKDMNELIKKEALIYYLDTIKSLEPDQQYEAEGQYEIKLMNDKVLSIAYSSYHNVVPSAHPYHLFYTTNIDMKTGKPLFLSDFVRKIDPSFVNLLKKAKYVGDIDEKYQQQIRNMAFGGYKSDEDLIQALMDKDGQSGIFVYVTETALGISMPVAHVVGDHAEFEIQMTDLKKENILNWN